MTFDGTGRVPTNSKPPEASPTADQPEGVTLDQLEARLSLLPKDKADRIRGAIRPAPLHPAAGAGEPAAQPAYSSWADFMGLTTVAERRAWCKRKAKTANRERLMSGRPANVIDTDTVWTVLAAAQGRCLHCGSLALEGRPSKPNGAPLPWESVGRRIGSLAHLVARVNGGANDLTNLAWSCLWCNVWPGERIVGAIDHGAMR